MAAETDTESATTAAEDMATERDVNWFLNASYVSAAANVAV